MLMSVSRTVDLDDTLSESALTSMLLGGKRLTMPFRHTVVGRCPAGHLHSGPVLGDVRSAHEKGPREIDDG
jgi:hypothetical protein